MIVYLKKRPKTRHCLQTESVRSNNPNTRMFAQKYILWPYKHATSLSQANLLSPSPNVLDENSLLTDTCFSNIEGTQDIKVANYQQAFKVQVWFTIIVCRQFCTIHS